MTDDDRDWKGRAEYLVKVIKRDHEKLRVYSDWLLGCAQRLEDATTFANVLGVAQDTLNIAQRVADIGAHPHHHAKQLNEALMARWYWVADNAKKASSSYGSSWGAVRYAIDLLSETTQQAKADTEAEVARELEEMADANRVAQEQQEMAEELADGR